MPRYTPLLGAGLAVVSLAGLLTLGREPSGAVVATVAVGRLPWRIVVDGRDGRAFVVNRGDGTVSMLDGGTGTLLRTLTVGADPEAAAVDERTGRLFVANGGDATVSVLDARAGTVVRTVAVGTSPQWPAVDERTNRVFVPNRSDNTVSVLDARTGAVLRTVAVSLLPSAAAVDERTDRVFIRCNSGWVAILDARNGAMLRTTRVGSAPWGQVAVDERVGRVFVTNPHDKTVSMLDARTGTLLRTVAVGIEAYRPVVDDRGGSVVVAGPSGSWGGVSVLDARTGTVHRTLAVGYTPWPAMAVGPGDSVLISAVGDTDSMGNATGDGAIRVVDPRAGVAAVPVPVGIFPVDIGVDRRTGRVFVVNYSAHLSDGSPIAPTMSETWWARVQRWLAGRVPLVPPPWHPPTRPAGTVTVLDATRLRSGS